MVIICLSSGAKVDARHPSKLVTVARYEQHKPAKQYGFTPLMYAAKGGYVDIVNTLLEARASLKARDEDGTTPLHISVSAGELEVCQALLTARADPEVCDDDGQSPLDCLPEDVSKDVRLARRWQAMFKDAQSAYQDGVEQNPSAWMGSWAATGPSPQEEAAKSPYDLRTSSKCV